MAEKQNKKSKIKNQKFGFPKWEKILIGAFVAVLGLSFILFLDPQLLWKKVSVGDSYTLKIPFTWNYKVNKDNEGVIISNYVGELSTQDRSSEKEKVRLTIVKIKTIDGEVDARIHIDSIISSYKKGEVNRIQTVLYGLPATRLVVASRSVEYWVVEKGDKLYTIFTVLYENSPINKEILSKVLASIHFSQ